MKNIKLLSFVLVFAMLFSMVGFAADYSESEIASKLQQIGLVSGDGTGLNLNGELTRAEAATFIVKLIGREDTVLASPSFYGMTPFTDVKGDEWYAPFVGYCSMNKIISGYPDNTFRADDKLTEKAFLAMVLKALKYTGDDFTWDNIFLTAYEKGIVTDLSYAVRVEDDTLDRGRVLAIEYNALNLYFKDNSMTLLDNLISNSNVTESKAVSLGLVSKDDKKTSITNAVATAINEVTVTLNEEIHDITTNQVALSTGSTDIDVTNVSLSGKKLVITADANLIGDDYDVTLLNVTDNENFVIKSISENFDGFEGQDVDSDYFRIQKVEGESRNIVNVYFTQPVNINASLVIHYEILQGGNVIAGGTYNDMEAAVIGEVDNGVALYMKSASFEEDVPYTVKVRGSLISAYDVNLNEGQDMTADFIGDDSSDRSLRVSDIEAISADTVRIVFNQDIDKNLALNITNYALKNATNDSNSAILSASMNETGPEKNRTLDLRVLEMSNNKDYELTILNARNVFKSSTLSSKTYSFEGGDYSSTKIKLEYVQPVSSTKLYLYFDMPIHPASIAANITGVDDLIATYSTDYNNRLTVYLDKDDPVKDNKDYTVQVTSGLIEASGKIQSYPVSYTFEGVDKSEGDISVDDARFISDNKVKITFDSEVSVSNTASQYRIQYKNEYGHDVSITADSINYVNEKTVVASFSNLPSESYEVIIYNIVDPSNQYTTQLITADVTKE